MKNINKVTLRCLDTGAVCQFERRLTPEHAAAHAAPALQVAQLRRQLDQQAVSAVAREDMLCAMLSEAKVYVPPTTYEMTVSMNCTGQFAGWPKDEPTAWEHRWHLACALDSTRTAHLAKTDGCQLVPWATVAKRLDLDGSPAHTACGRVSVFLPLLDERSGLPAQLNGLFEVDNVRRNLQWAGKPWNPALMAGPLAGAYVELTRALAAKFQRLDTALSMLPHSASQN